MEKLRATKKITLTTLKAFAKRNADNLFIKELSSFDGMTDCVERVEDDFRQTEVNDQYYHYKTGIQGVYTVGQSRDYFSIYEDATYYGIEVSNCCGSSILAIKK